MPVLSLLLTLVKMQGEPVVLPPRPVMISQREYKTLGEYASLGERGYHSVAFAGLSALGVHKKVSIGMDVDSISDGPVEAYRQAISRAIRSWNSWLGTSTFVWTRPETKPDIQIRFVDRITSSHQGDLLGQLNIHREILTDGTGTDYFLSGEIQAIQFYKGRILSEVEMTEIVTHELGHLLGLEDHDKPEGIMGMYQSGNPRTVISYLELESLQIYRETIRAVQNRIRIDK